MSDNHQGGFVRPNAPPIKMVGVAVGNAQEIVARWLYPHLQKKAPPFEYGEQAL